jgi:hypothetical protein
MLFVDAGNNRVGIGKASPATILSAGTGTGTNAITINGVDSSTSVNQLIFHGGGTNNPSAAIEYDGADKGLAFQVGNHSSLGSSERARIDTSGRLLVGLSSDLSGGTSSTAIQISTTGGGFLGLGRNDSSVSAGNSLGGLRIYSNAPSGYDKVADIRCEADGTFAADDYPSRWVFTTTADGASSPTERLRIDSSGNVGINNSSPGHALHIITSGAGQIRIADGSRAAALGSTGSIGFVGSVTSANGFAFYAGNSEAARFNSNGNFGIGTTSPSSILHVNKNNTNNTPLSHNYPATQSGVFVSNNQTGTTGAFSAVTLRAHNSNGSAQSASIIAQSTGSGFSPSLLFTQRSGSGTNAERMRIDNLGFASFSTNISDSARYDSGGYHTIHSDNTDAIALALEHSGASPYGMLISFSDAAPDNNGNYYLKCNDNSTDRLIIWSDGDIDNHDNSYGAISDVKLKQDIVDAGSQWDDIKDLRVRKFKFKSDVAEYGDEAKTLIGVVAQEAELVSPGLVKESSDVDEDGNDLGTTTKSVRYSVLYMKAIKALQEAQTRIETLESQHADLLARVAALEAG